MSVPSELDNGHVTEERSPEAAAARDSSFSFAATRLIASFVIVVLGLIGDNTDVAFWAIVAIGVVWMFVTNGLALRSSWNRLPMLVVSLGDAVLVFGLLITSGGAFSPVALAILTFPPAWALAYPENRIATVGALFYLGYLAAALPDLVDGTAGAGRALAAFSVVFAGACGFAILAVRARRRGITRLTALHEERRVLLSKMVQAEQRERQRLSEHLHDEALQVLLAARQDLDEAAGGNPEALERGRDGLTDGLARLRETVRDLHPTSLTAAGLESALRGVCELQGRRAGFDSTVKVDTPAVGLHEELLALVAREAIINVAKHAHARHVDVRVERKGAQVVLTVVDNGNGMDADRPDVARAQGHIGLASCEERVDAAGGIWRVHGEPGEGTTVTVVLPVAAAVPAGASQ